MALKFNALSGQLDVVLDKAEEIKFDPSSTTFVTATDVQNAIEELDAELAGLPTPIFYAGTWDANANNPDLDLLSARVQGALYYVTVAGTHDFGAFGGIITFGIGDTVVFNGTVWDKWDNTDAVISVQGQTGAVSLDTDDIPEGVAQYFTDERAQDAVGGILSDTAKINLDYDDLTPAITADIVPNSLDDNDISPTANITRSKLAAGTVNRLVYNEGPSGLMADLPAITANRALESNANGLPVASAVTSTELGYLSGVTSSIQTQLNSKFGFTISSQNTNFTAASNFIYLVDSSGGPITVTLPAPSLNAYIEVKDSTGSANTNSIVIDTPGAELIDGQAQYTINSNYGSVRLISNGTNWFAL